MYIRKPDKEPVLSTYCIDFGRSSRYDCREKHVELECQMDQAVDVVGL
jgi:hypothetical protein